MASRPFDASAYDTDDMHIWCNRRRNRVRLDTYPLQGLSFDMPVPDFVAWCQKNGCKLRTKIVGSIYLPDFRDDEAAEHFRATWMTEKNLDPLVRMPGPPVQAVVPGPISEAA